MEKNLHIALLLDYYGGLLTPKQRDLVDLYYNEDLSLGEIAEQENITRQAVRDSIKRGEQALTEFENTLRFAERSAKLLKVAAALEKAATEHVTSTADDTDTPDSKAMLKAAADIRKILEE
ncbi:MAG: DNA-binding protein [Oscillospiraceae bacterium]|nr:DNA-binding protein [Oscillospiraceae bacterium]